MTKFKIKMKLQGFELEMEGEREDIPMMAQNVGQQLMGMLEPAANIAKQQSPRKSVVNTVLPSDEIEAKSATKGSRKSGSGKKSKEPAVEWKHNPQEWGHPVQNWNPTNKAIWLLYVADNCASTPQMTAGRIASTFNAKFKTAGIIRGSNVSRDLGKAMATKPPVVGQDTSSNNEFFLTDAGKQLGAKLVAEARGSSEPNGLYSEA